MSQSADFPLLAAFLVDLADKAITVIVALTIYKLLPKKLIENLRSRERYYIAMFPKKSDRQMKGVSLRVKMTLLVTFSTFLVASSAIGICVVQYHNSTIERFTKQAQRASHVIAAHVDGSRIEEYLAKGKEAEGYRDTEELMQSVSDASPDIKYIYAYRIEEDGTHVIFDLDTESVAANKPGKVIPYDTTIEKYADLLLRGEDMPMDITYNQYGWLLTVYTAVRDDAGKTLCYVGVDMSMDTLHSDEAAFLAKIISLFIGVLVLIRTYAVWRAECRIVAPIKAMADAANARFFHCYYSIRCPKSLPVHPLSRNVFPICSVPVVKLIKLQQPFAKNFWIRGKGHASQKQESRTDKYHFRIMLRSFFRDRLCRSLYFC